LLGGTFAVPLFCLAVATWAQESDTFFQMLLPVTVRQVFASRLLASLFLLWLPVSTGAVAFVALRDSVVLVPMLRMWSAVTCVELGIQCATIRGFAFQAGLPLLPMIAWGYSLAASGLYGMQLRNSTGMSLALAGCWLLCAAAIVWTWGTAPAAFQFGTKGPSSESPKPVRTTSAKTGSTPIPALLTAFPAFGIGYVFSFALTAMIYSPLLVSFMAISGQDWSSGRDRLRCMAGLPVQPRAMMAVVFLPGPLSMVSGYLAFIYIPFLGHHEPHPGLRMQVLSIVFIVAMSTMWKLVAMATSCWRPRWAWGLILHAMTAGQITITAFTLMTGADPVKRLSSAFAISMGGTVAVAALLLGVLLVAMDTLFRRLEFL